MVLAEDILKLFWLTFLRTAFILPLFFKKKKTQINSCDTSAENSFKALFSVMFARLESCLGRVVEDMRTETGSSGQRSQSQSLWNITTETNLWSLGFNKTAHVRHFYWFPERHEKRKPCILFYDEGRSKRRIDSIFKTWHCLLLPSVVMETMILCRPLVNDCGNTPA